MKIVRFPHCGLQWGSHKCQVRGLQVINFSKGEIDFTKKLDCLGDEMFDESLCTYFYLYSQSTLRFFSKVEFWKYLVSY